MFQDLSPLKFQHEAGKLFLSLHIMAIPSLWLLFFSLHVHCLLDVVSWSCWLPRTLHQNLCHLPSLLGFQFPTRPPRPFWWMKYSSQAVCPSLLNFPHLSQSVIARASLWVCHLPCLLFLVPTPWAPLFFHFPPKMSSLYPLGLKYAQK